MTVLIQAEEAQRLRKRRRDESCLTDLQRRQKQCTEEVRDPQKKVYLIFCLLDVLL